MEDLPAGKGAKFKLARIMAERDKRNNYPEGFKDAGTPVRAVVLTWLLTQIVILVGDLDLLLPVVSGCFLICFCAVNLTCFVLEFSPRAQQRNRHFRLYSFRKEKD